MKIKRKWITFGILVGAIGILTPIGISLTSCGGNTNKEVNKSIEMTPEANPKDEDMIIKEPKMYDQSLYYYKLPESQVKPKLENGKSWTPKLAEEYWQNKLNKYKEEDFKNDLNSNLTYQNNLLTKLFRNFNWSLIPNSNKEDVYFRQFLILKLDNVHLNENRTLNITFTSNLVTQIGNHKKEVIAQQSINNTFKYTDLYIAPFLVYSDNDVYASWAPTKFKSFDISINQSHLLNFPLIEKNMDYINKKQDVMIENVDTYKIHSKEFIDEKYSNNEKFTPNWNRLSSFSISSKPSYETYSFFWLQTYIGAQVFSNKSLLKYNLNLVNFLPGAFQSSGKNNFSFGNIKELTNLKR